MTDRNKKVSQHRPTGQEMDREYDERHASHDGDGYPTRREQREEKKEELEDIAEDLRDPD